jgi:hypothetical protein
VALTKKRELFAQEMALSGGQKVESYKKAGYTWQNMSPNALGVEADRLSKVPSVSLRIKELTTKAVAKAEKKFSISFEQRLEWLQEVVNAGLGEYADAVGNMRKENLPATRNAIETMNSMLAVVDAGNGDVDDTVNSIQVTIVK